MKKTGALLSLSILLILTLLGCAESSTKETGEVDAEYGGTLKVAMSAQPPTLDVHLTTSVDAVDVSTNIYETLVAQNNKRQAAPMLAESVEQSEDGLTYIFKLREGVKFHNGKEMTSEDVVASMNRWLEVSSRGILLLEGSKFVASDTYTVELNLANAVTDVLDILAGRGQFPAIMPSEVIASANEDGVTEYIGTGPFKFNEWKQDQFIRLEKFADYSASENEPDGITGRKTVYVDSVEFHIIKDSSTRMAGVQTGEYDIALRMPFDNYDQLMDTENLETYSSFDNGTINVVYNKKEGILTNPEIRKALNTGLDANSIMLGAVGNEDLYRLSPSYMSLDQVDWATDTGKEAYNLGDKDESEKMLKEAGYDGEELVLISTRDYDHQYNAAVVLKEQLEQIGVKVKLEIYDWPTLLDKRTNPDNWDLMIVVSSYVTTPSQLLVVNPNWPGWTDDEKITSSLQSIRTAETLEEGKELWSELQGYIWEDYVPHTLFGHYASIITTTDQLEDLTIFNTALLWEVKKQNK